MSGTSSSLLARRFESALLVNVDNMTLSRLMANPNAMEALMNIEGFRNLNKDIETIITSSEKVKKAKSESEALTPKEKKEISKEEKEYKSKRKLIQEKLIKFATRIPIFMYLTDFREYSLKDVITQLEPGLFKKVTGLEVKDFELLVSLGVFNGPVMNDAIYKFKRYEDASLEYAGINRHKGESVGGFDTVITEEEYQKFYASQQSPSRSEIDQKPDVNNDNSSIGKIPEVSKSESAFDMSIEVNDPVIHKTFGQGIVTKIYEDKITVRFGKSEKMFIFPDTFKNGFLEKI
jgi:hypothetical protein